MATSAGAERLASGERRFANDDADARYWLEFLRSGTVQEKVQARGSLALIFEHRGMLDEAIELLETNGRSGVHEPELFTRLARLYRCVGRDDDAGAALAEASVASKPRPDLGQDPVAVEHHASRNGASHPASGAQAGPSRTDVASALRYSAARAARAGAPRRALGRSGWTPSAIGLALFLAGSLCFAVLWLLLSIGNRSEAAVSASHLDSRPDDSTPVSTQPASLSEMPTPSGGPTEDGSGDAGARRAYAAEVLPTLLAAGASTQRMSDLAKRAGDDPQLLLDSAWKREMMDTLADVRAASTQCQQQRAVPTASTELDGTVAAVGKDLAYIADEMQAGIDGPNARRLQNALTRTNDVNTRLPVLQRQMEALGAG